MDLASVHHPDQYLVNLPSNLIQKLWQWSYSDPVGSTEPQATDAPELQVGWMNLCLLDSSRHRGERLFEEVEFAYENFIFVILFISSVLSIIRVIDHQFAFYFSSKISDIKNVQSDKTSKQTYIFLFFSHPEEELIANSFEYTPYTLCINQFPHF